MIICSIGHGYLASFLFKQLSSYGVMCYGVSDKIENVTDMINFKIFLRKDSKYVLNSTTHLLITAPPDKYGCPIFNSYSGDITDTNIRSILYTSTTGVYGNHNGEWVNEESTLKATNSKDKNRIKAEKQWKNFSIKNNIKYNILRLSSIYGPNRLNNFKNDKNIIAVKKNFFFSRIHVYDAARIITNIIFGGFNNEIWNLTDNKPSTREDYLMEIIRLRNIRKYEIIDYNEYKKKLSKTAKKFWENNKKVSNNKITVKLKYRFLFPDFKSGLKNLKKYL